MHRRGRMFSAALLAIAAMGCDGAVQTPDSGTGFDASLDSGPDAQQTDAGPCDTCDADHCVEGACVACTEATQAEDCGAGAFCVDHTCVGCRSSADCDGSTGGPACVEGACAPCTSDDQCTAHADAPVCDEASGHCVECDADHRSRCAGNACRPDGTCSEHPLGTQQACQPCDTDANCAAGHLCVQLLFPTVGGAPYGRFCQWRKDATGVGAPQGECADTRIESQPWARELPAAESVDGEVADVCTLATTTCPALLQHRTEVTGCTAPTTGDAACGVEGLNDGRCRLNSGLNPRCTYPCLGPEDCRPGSTCPSVGDQVCSI